VIASVAFRRFKALRHTSVALGPFNLVVGANSSGKTSLLEALLHLRTLAKLAPLDDATEFVAKNGPEIAFTFSPPHAGVTVRLGCTATSLACDALHVAPAGAPDWPALQGRIERIRSFDFDPDDMTAPAPLSAGGELAEDGRNLAAVLARMKAEAPVAFRDLETEAFRLMPQFTGIVLRDEPDDAVSLALELRAGEGIVAADDLSQGAVYLLALLALSFAPEPPAVICLEEIDRGLHPRLLREVRDLLYRLTHPASFGLSRPPVQVITTTHSPYFIDLFRDHPEEVIITQRHGREARFTRLADRPDLGALLQDGTLGDLWFSGILGGVPEDEI
jgi:predicted ATPase